MWTASIYFQYPVPFLAVAVMHGKELAPRFHRHTFETLLPFQFVVPGRVSRIYKRVCVAISRLIFELIFENCMMRKELKQILIRFKSKIIPCFTRGALQSLLAELSPYFTDEDVEKIECDTNNVGTSWGVDGLVDCLKSSQEIAFTKFLVFLEKDPAKRDLYEEICCECIRHGFGAVIPNVSNKGSTNLASSRASDIAVIRRGDKKQAVKAMLKDLKPKIRQSFTEGSLRDMLCTFEAEFNESDVEGIKLCIRNEGACRAVDRFLECLLKCDKRTFKKFIAYLSMRKLDLYLEVKDMSFEYGLSQLLPQPQNSERPQQLDIHGSLETVEASCAAMNSKHVETISVEETVRDQDELQKQEMQLPGNSTIIGQQTTSSPISVDPPEVEVSRETNYAKLSLSNLTLSSGPRNEKKIESYKMSSSPKGICLIMNNMDFRESRIRNKTGHSDRTGSDIDENKLDEVFKWLGFDVRIFKDKTALEMWNILLEWSKTDHSKYDCFSVCVLSHGLRNISTGEDEICGVDGKTFTVDAMVNLYNGRNCKSLIDKPKLFFLQCCRSINKETIVSAKGSCEADGIADTQIQHSLPIACDFFIGYSTPPGFKSWRHMDEGSWYISKLCEVFADLSHDNDLMAMVTKINHEVSKFYTENGCQQVPNPSMTLRKLLYFNPVTQPKNAIN